MLHTDLGLTVLEKDPVVKPEHLAMVLDVGHMGQFSWNLVTNEVKRSQVWYDLFGGSKDDPVEQSYAKWLNVLHPADRDKMRLAAEDLLNSADSRVICEYRVNTANGETIWLREYDRIVERDAAGKPLCIVGVYMDITAEKRAVAEREELISSLQAAQDEIKELRGIIPICSLCHDIRDEQGAWQRLEAYITKHSNAFFSHGICPDCMVGVSRDLDNQ